MDYLPRHKSVEELTFTENCMPCCAIFVKSRQQVILRRASTNLLERQINDKAPTMSSRRSLTGAGDFRIIGICKSKILKSNARAARVSFLRTAAGPLLPEKLRRKQPKV